MSGPARIHDRPRLHLRTSEAEISILTATERLLNRAPLAELSVADIMAEAGVARGTFYHYFSSKYAVLTALMEQVRDELFTTFSDDLDRLTGPDPDPAAALETSLHPVIARWATHRAVLRAASDHWRVVPELHGIWLGMFDQFADAVAHRVEQHRASGQAPPGPDARALAAALVHGSERTLYVAGLGVDPDFPDEAAMAPYVIRMWTSGLYGSTNAISAGSEDTPAVVPTPPAAGSEQTILDATARLLEHTPLADLSAKQICEEAGIGRTTFYRHFNTKNDVVATLVNTALDQAYLAFQATSARPPADLRETLERRLIAMSGVWTRHRAVLRAAMEGWQQLPELAEVWLRIIDRYGRTVADEIDTARRAGHAPDGLPSAPLAKALAWMTESCMYIAGLEIDPRFPDETAAARTAATISVRAIYRVASTEDNRST
ncbi:MAG TPA: TetR/AcrR family transcriptional regulator [Pseudonocardia sp.]